MDFILQIILIILAIVFVGFVLVVTKKKQLSYRYTILWLVFSLMIVIVAVFPQLMKAISELVHIQTPVNTLFLVLMGAVILILFFITIGYSKHSEKITKLVQTNALLEKRVRELEEQRK